MKKTVCILLTGIIFASLLSGCGKKEVTEDENYVVKISMTGGLCEAPLVAAVEKGYLDDAGIKYELNKIESAQIADTLSTKKADASLALISKMAQPLENGLEAKLTEGLHTGCLKILVGANSPITSAKELKGKKIGIPGMASSNAVLTERVLAHEGIGVTNDNLQVEWQVFNSADLPLAIQNGSVDAVTISDPQASITEKSGILKTIYNQATDDLTKDEYCCGLFEGNDFIKEHPQLAKKLSEALFKGSQYVSEHKEEITKIQVDKKYCPGDAQTNAQIIQTYKYDPSIEGGKEALRNNIKDLQEIGLIKKDTDVDALTENSFEDVSKK